MNRQRRIKAFYLSADLILDFFRILTPIPRGHYFSIPEFDADLPEDARVECADYRMERGAFFIVVHSKTFEPVELGDAIPLLGPDTFGGFAVKCHTYRIQKDGSFRKMEDEAS